MRNLILSRHGNTFGPGDRVFWVGAKNDLPLVEAGIAQAQNLADALVASGITLDAIYCAPLQRTRQYAEIVKRSAHSKAPLIVEERLNELDYGQWSGLNDEEIGKRFGTKDLENWNDSGIWPAQGGWGKSENDVIEETGSFAKELLDAYGKDASVLAVTSNGRLRMFLKLFPDIFADYSRRKMLKVATGKVCLFVEKDAGNLTLAAWNAEPMQVLALTTGLPTGN